MECIHLERSAVIQQRRNDYLSTLAAPTDGMWESTAIAHATFWDIQDRGHHVGHFCLGAENELLRFHLVEAYQARAKQIFRWIVSTYGIQQAVTSTIEPLYFSCCLARQRSIVLHSYLFRDHKRAEVPSPLSASDFRKAGMREADEITRFYYANTEGSGEWIQAFLHERLQREEVFGLYEQRRLVATGECIPSQTQRPYADLGVVVAQSHRGRGLGSSMLVQLKSYCYETHWTPICSCDADNGASKKAIERAGFISDQRMVKIVF